MASTPIPAPPSSGPGPGGGFSSPAAGQSGGDSSQLLNLVRTIVASTRMIANKVPAATPEVRQINDLVAQIQQKIIGQQPPAETQAPPV